jgi:hypothetical protein
MIYKWKDGSHHRIDPQIAGEELERIRTWNNGRLEPIGVVEASSVPGAPLHDAFDWNDKVAGHKWRLEQAGAMIRHIAVMVEGSTSNAPVRAFVSVKRDEDRSYTSLQHAMSDEQLRAQVVAAALSELEAWQRRHAELIELAKIFSAIDQARDAE